MRASLAAAFGCVMAAAYPALAQPQASDLAGRWVSSPADAKEACGDAGCQFSYDLVPCSNGWCGVEVKEGKTCGRTALRLDAGASTQFGITFFGSFERAAATQPYAVKVQLYVQPQPGAPGRLMLFMQGSTDGDFQPFRRTYPMQMLMTRAGDAVCQAEQRTS
jgi:hypothetical protein